MLVSPSSTGSVAQPASEYTSSAAMAVVLIARPPTQAPNQRSRARKPTRAASVPLQTAHDWLHPIVLWPAVGRCVLAYAHDMSIRPVHNDDFDAIAAITNHYIASSAIHFAYEPLHAD